MPPWSSLSFTFCYGFSLSAAVGGRCGNESADVASAILTGGQPAEAQGQLLPKVGLRCCDFKWRMCHIFLLSMYTAIEKMGPNSCFKTIWWFQQGNIERMCHWVDSFFVKWWGVSSISIYMRFTTGNIKTCLKSQLGHINRLWTINIISHLLMR